MKISYDQEVNKQHFPTVEIFLDLSSFSRLSCNVEEIPQLSRLSVSPPPPRKGNLHTQEHRKTLSRVGSFESTTLGF